MRSVVLLILCILAAGCAQFQHPYEDPQNLGKMIAEIQRANPRSRVAVRATSSDTKVSPETLEDKWFEQMFHWKVSADDGFAHHWFTIFEMKIGSPKVRYEIIIINGTNQSDASYEGGDDNDTLSPVINDKKK